MTKEVADAIANAAKRNKLDVSVRNSYSGRGMGDNATYAIVMDSHAEFVTAVACAASEMEPRCDDAIEFCDACLAFRFDSMGRGLVIY